MKMGDLLKFKSTAERLELIRPCKCASCGIALQESITGCRGTYKGYVCSDCYYDMMGEAVEAQPIGVPRMHRGA